MAIWDLNLRYTYELPVGGVPSRDRRSCFDLFHVGSPRRAVGIDQVHYTAVDESGNQTGVNQNYGMVTRYQPPMSARLGVVVRFE